MPTKGHISNLEDLEVWFKSIDSPKWKLYNGHMDKISNDKFNSQEMDMSDVDESWMKLKSILKMSSNEGGEFTLFMPLHNNRGPRTKISLNMPPKVHGIRGYGYGAPMLGYVPQDEVDRRIAQERRTWELERRVEDLAAENEAKLSFGERLFEKVVEEVDLNQVAGLLGGFLKKGGPSGINPSIQAEPMTDEGGTYYDGDRIMPLLDQIRPYFQSEEAFYGFLDKVREVFAKNPEMCLSFFQNVNNE